MKRMKGWMAVIVFSANLMMATSATADLIYNNMGTSGAAYSLTGGVAVYGNSTYQAAAVAFTPSGSFTLSQLTVPLKLWDTAYVADSRVDLVTDSSGKPGTSVLESWIITSLSPPTAPAFYLQTFTSTGSTQLLSGTKYWVEITPTDTTTSFPWTKILWLVSTVSTVESGNFATKSPSSGTWTIVSNGNNVPGLTVEGTPVPIPAAAWLLGSGLVGLVGLRRRFKK